MTLFTANSQQYPRAASTTNLIPHFSFFYDNPFCTVLCIFRPEIPSQPQIILPRKVVTSLIDLSVPTWGTQQFNGLEKLLEAYSDSTTDSDIDYCPRLTYYLKL